MASSVGYNSVDQDARWVRLKGHEGKVNCVAISHGGRHILSAANDFTAKIWDLEGQVCEKTLRHSDCQVTHAIFSEDDEKIVTISNRTIAIWNRSGEISARMEVEISGFIPTAIALSLGDHRYLYYGDERGRVNKLQLEDLRCLSVIKAHRRGVEAIAFSPNGEKAVSVDTGWGIIFWNVGAELSLIRIIKNYTVFLEPRRVVFSLDSSRVIGAGGLTFLHIWDLDGEAKKRVAVGSCIIYSLTLDKSGSKVLVGANRGRISLVDLNKKKVIYRYQCDSDPMPICGVAISPDSAYMIAAVGNDLMLHR